MDVLPRRALGLLAMCLAGGLTRQGRAAEAPITASSCVIRGPGELVVHDEDGRRRHQPQLPFPIFASRSRTTALAEVTYSMAVKATWSRLPEARRGGPARLHLESDGLHVAGWANIGDRLFQLDERADIVPDRLWARRSAPVRVVGLRGPLVVVEVETSPLTMTAPARIALATTCGNVIYEPRRRDAAADAAPRAGDIADLTTGALTLAPEPGKPPFLRMLLPRDRPAFSAPEVRGNWVRITGGDSVIGFDAWVPAWQVSLSDGGLGSGLLGGDAGAGYPREGDHVGVARRDAPVRVGATGDVQGEVGVLVARSRVLLDPETRTATAIAFTLPAGRLVAPAGQRFWIALADVAEIGHAPLGPDPAR
jgi:hypothetical protein